MTEPTESATDRAYRGIRDDILGGVLRPGTMLGESSLAAQFGVSRTPVRTALARLQDEGWVTIYPKRGALVQGLSDRALRDLADARLTLEVTAVQRASPAVRQSLSDRLEEAIARQAEAFRERDLPCFIELTIAFHRSFVAASRNDVLLELNSRLADRHRFVLFSQEDHLLARCEAIIDEHRRLVAALRSGDVAGFAEILRAHLGDAEGRPLEPLFPVPAAETSGL